MLLMYECIKNKRKLVFITFFLQKIKKILSVDFLIAEDNYICLYLKIFYMNFLIFCGK